MLIPYGTDAPIYHLPIATGVMIALNAIASIAAWSATGGGWYIAESESGELLWWVSESLLLYGHGLRPWQWVTSNFMHADVLHLMGNMFCLWGFGLVVEGKIGWWRFVALYLGIGILQCAMEQTLMLFADEGLSLGASAIIYGLLAIGMIWAPRNEMNCVFLLGFRVITFDAELYTIATFALLLELGTGFLAGLSMTSQVLHLMGAAVGTTVGIVMLKKKWVDCEGWDLFNVWQGKEYSAREEDDAAAKALLEEAHRNRMRGLNDGAATSSQSSQIALPQVTHVPMATLTPTADPEANSYLVAAMRQALAAGDPGLSWRHFADFTSDPLNWPVPERELQQTIALFHKQQQWSPSIPALVAYLRYFSEREVAVRLKLAQILLEAEKRPGQALQVLEKLNEPLLPDKERQMLQKLRAIAEKRRSSCPLELVEDW